MKESDLELKVGALVLGALAVLALFVFTLGNFSLGKGYVFYVDYRFSGNVQAGAPVRVSGIKVGKIQEVQFLGGRLDEKTGKRVQVRLKVWVQERVKETIRSDAEFFINTAGVLGEQYLEVVPGNYDQPPLPAGAVVLGVDPPRTDLIMARLYAVLDGVTTLLHDDKDLLRGLLTDAAGAVHEVHVVLKDNRETIGKVLASTDRLASNGADLLAQVRDGVGDPKIFGRMLGHVDSTIAHADESITTLTPKAATLLDEGARLTGMVTKDRGDKLFATMDAVGVLIDRGAEALATTNTILTGLAGGKGTAGRILVKDDLYADIKEMVVDLKKNPWKIIWKE